jgi:hypothetical protein
MGSWIVPPIAIPVVLAVVILGEALYRAFA